MKAQLQYPAPLNRRERRATETREKLFRSALRLFAERGVANTTVEDITNAADVGKGTFFNYCPSKEHVLAELASIQIGKVSQAASAVESGASTQQVFRSLIRALAEEPARTPNLSRSLLIGILSSDATREFITSRFAEGRQVLARILALGQQRGEVRRDLQPLDLAMSFQQQLFGTIVMWSIHPGMDLGRMLDATLEVYLHGISDEAAKAASMRNISKTRSRARKESL
jgi:AcrR family transcriptional regulator